jgi:thioredoxin-like negative regulator of GroEL
MSSIPESPANLIKFLKKNKCTIIKCSANWCVPCKNKDFLAKYHELENLYTGNTNVTFFNLDVDVHEELVNEKKLYDFNIKVVPTIKIFHHDKLVNEYKGIPKMSDIKKDIDTVLKN